MSPRVTGLDKLANDLDEAVRASGSLDGEIARAQFDPADSASVEKRAIADIERTIDSKLASSQSNALVASIATEMKAKYRDQILEQMAAVREGNWRKLQ